MGSSGQVLNMEQFFCEQVLMQIYGCTSVQSHRSTGASRGEYSRSVPLRIQHLLHLSGVCTKACIRLHGPASSWVGPKGLHYLSEVCQMLLCSLQGPRINDGSAVHIHTCPSDSTFMCSKNRQTICSFPLYIVKCERENGSRQNTNLRVMMLKSSSWKGSH